MINDGIAMINGTQYGWSDIKLRISGALIVGIKGVEYSKKRNSENIYGMGSAPIGRGYGNVECTGKLTLTRDEVVALQKAAPGRDITNYAPFDITVSYVPENASKILTDTIKYAQFKENPVSWTQGDVSKDVDLELIVGDIIYG